MVGGVAAGYSAARIRAPADYSQRSRIRTLQPLDNVWPEVVTHVLGTFCHRSSRWTRTIGAGEGIRTLDPDLGKVVPRFVFIFCRVDD